MPSDATSVSRALLLARTLRHLHPMQVAFRPLHVVRTRLLAASPRLASLVAGHPAVRAGPPLLALQGSIPPALPGVALERSIALRALAGEVELVGRTLPIAAQGTDWNAAGQPKLVRYQLTYLGVVRSLAIASRIDGFERRHEAARLAVELIRDFVSRVPPGLGDAWEPYPVAMRTLNLVVARELLREAAGDDDRRFLDGELVRELGRHGRYLVASLELHLLGNHLFTDGAALCVVGEALEGCEPRAWRAIGRAIVSRSLRTDVLADGGHAERSPMYAAIYLDQLELMLAAWRARGAEPPKGATDAAIRMARQLLATAHPDGDIPLLGDSAFDEAPLPTDLAAPLGLAPTSLRGLLYGALAHAIPEPPPVVFADTGVAAVREGDSLLVVDAGPLGTSDQPGHAHSDALSFELSHAGRRLISDGGAGHYEADEARAFFRGPRAHSAVSVDGNGPDELWGAFRAGARGKLQPLRYEARAGFHVLRGGVRSPSGWRHERLLLWHPGHVLAVFDRVVGARRGARVESHVHFAPDVRVGGDGELRVEQDVHSFELRVLQGSLAGVHVGEQQPMRGFTARRLGRFEPSPEVAIEAAGEGGVRVAAWALRLGDASVSGADGRWRLEAGGRALLVTLAARGLGWRVEPAI